MSKPCKHPSSKISAGQTLTPVEEARAYQRLIDEFQYLHEEVAASVGKSRAAITNSLRLLNFDPRIPQKYLMSGELTEGHGKILAGLEPHHQIDLAERCVQKTWNVRKMEAEAKPRKTQVLNKILIVTLTPNI